MVKIYQNISKGIWHLHNERLGLESGLSIMIYQFLHGWPTHQKLIL
jgi:hypothetical protein